MNVVDSVFLRDESTRIEVFVHVLNEQFFLDTRGSEHVTCQLPTNSVQIHSECRRFIDLSKNNQVLWALLLCEIEYYRAHIHTYMQNIHAYIHAWCNACVTTTHTHSYIHTCINTGTYTYICTHTYVHIHTRMNAYILYKHMHTYIHTFISIYIHAYALKGSSIYDVHEKIRVFTPFPLCPHASTWAGPPPPCGRPPAVDIHSFIPSGDLWLRLIPLNNAARTPSYPYWTPSTPIELHRRTYTPIELHRTSIELYRMAYTPIELHSTSASRAYFKQDLQVPRTWYN